MSFRSVALLQSHQRIPALHDYYVPDLVELCGLAAVIRQDVDDVWLPVSPVDREPLAAFERFVRRHRPQLVGISSFTCGARSALEYAEIAKRFGAFVVLGGYHPTAEPDEMLASPDVDAVVRGQGEESLLELVRRGSPDGIDGISYRDNGGVVHGPARTTAPALDELPLPLRELRPERFGLSGLDYHTDTIYASRGCRGRCVFCANHLIGGSWRSRSLDGIMAELETIRPARKRAWKNVKFWDSNFLTDPDRVAHLCAMILEGGFRRHFRFIVETRAEDIVRAAEILPAMQSAGFCRIGCGVESPSRTTHRELNKGINLSHVDRAAVLLERANIQLTKFLIVGHEHEGEADIKAYPDYALSHGVKLKNTTFFVMTPYPGTELAERYAREGLVASRDWNLYTNFGSVVAPNGISALRLQVLHAAVAIRHGTWRRFLAGKGASSVLGKLIEPLLLLAAVGVVRGGRPPEEIAADLHDALAAAAGEVERPTRSRRRRFGDRLAVTLSHLDREPATVAVVADGDRERLVIGPRSRIPGDPRRVELRLEAATLVRTAGKLDYQRLAADALTLYWRPSALSPARAFTVIRGLGAIAALAAGVAAGSLRPGGRR
jgi:magnesium-protoporphyrin IX monomethyl ester (oxidative) cyclase